MRAVPVLARPVWGWIGLTLLGAYVHLAELAAVEWKNDEVGYRNAGLAYLQGDFTLNTEHPFLVKYLYGIAQSLAGGGSPTAVRVVSGLAALATTAVVVALVTRAAGRGAGLLAGLLWVLLPHPVQLGVRADSVAPKLERIAGLDAVMVLFLSLALLLCWRWFETGRWWHALAAGVSVGLAGGSKAAAAFVVPAFVLMAVHVAQRDGRWAPMLRQGAAAAAAAALIFLATYLPDLGSLPSHLGDVLGNASAQAAGGHAVIIAGERYDTAPWWSLAYWQWAGQGTVVTACLGALCALAPFRRRLPGRLVALLLLSIAIPFVWLSLFTGFLLSHYAAIYQVPLAVLAALVLADLARGARRERVVAIALGAVLLGAAAVRTIGYVAGLEPTGYAVLNDAAELVPADSRIAVSGNAFTVAAYFPDSTVTGSPQTTTAYDAVVVQSRGPIAPAVAAVLAQGRWRLVLDTDAVDLYLPVA